MLEREAIQIPQMSEYRLFCTLDFLAWKTWCDQLTSVLRTSPLCIGWWQCGCYVADEMKEERRVTGGHSERRCFFSEISIGMEISRAVLKSWPLRSLWDLRHTPYPESQSPQLWHWSLVSSGDMRIKLEPFCSLSPLAVPWGPQSWNQFTPALLRCLAKLRHQLEVQVIQFELLPHSCQVERKKLCRS